MREGPPVTEFEVPSRDGGVLIAPPARAFAQVAAANGAALDAAAATVGGLPLARFRAAARLELAAAAHEATAGWGIAAPRLDPVGPLTVTGHQPLLFHPGIWLKTLLLDACCGGRAVNLIVDTDAGPEIGVDVPARREGLVRARVTLGRPPDDAPLEVVPAPSAAEWDAFLARVRAHLETVGSEELLERLDLFARASHAALEPGQSVAAMLARARRLAEGPRRYLELPVSAASRTAAFARLVWEVVRRPGRFAGTYNRALQAYRAQQGIRNAANPFPDLAADGDVVESPFWIVLGGCRRPLFVRPAGREIELRVDGDRVGALAADDPARAPERLADLQVRPRALTLTMFVRLAGDLFIHGVGGGRYDRVTDAVIEAWFGIRPPRYAVASGTFYLPLAPTPGEQVVQRLERHLLDLRHNPDRFLADPPPGARALVDEKWRLIERLGDGALPRRERRALTRRIREVNERLTAFVGDRIAETETALARARAGRAEAEVTEARDFPFFLHDPARIERAVLSA